MHGLFATQEHHAVDVDLVQHGLENHQVEVLVVAHQNLLVAELRARVLVFQHALRVTDQVGVAVKELDGR